MIFLFDFDWTERAVRLRSNWHFSLFRAQ
jgi:hypothetical protein